MIDLSWVQLAIAFVLPLVVGFVTKEVSSSKKKGLLLAALSAVAGLGTAYVNSKGVLTEVALQEAVQYFIVAVGVYFGLLKPTGVSGALQSATKDIGI